MSSNPAPQGLPLEETDAERGSAWRRLTWLERCVIAGATLCILLTGLPRLAPGICFGDAGDLQVACATAGIAHPPGYVGYTTVGRLLCGVFFFADPAYVVSAACLAAMTVALLILTLLLLRLGLHVFLACSVPLLLTSYRYVWQSITVPEVYAPSFALLAGAMYLLVKYGQLSRRRDLYLSALLFGFLAVNRPPALAYGIGFLAGLLVIELRREGGFRRSLRPVFRAGLGTLLPILVCLLLLWLRDVPETRYNYITHLAEQFALPDSGAESADRWERLHWLVSAEEYRSLMGTTPTQARGKVLWFLQTLGVDAAGPVVCGLALLGLGTYLLRRCSLVCGLLAWGTIIGCVPYLLFYRVYGQAADLLPLLLAGSLLMGAALSVVFPTDTRRLRPIAAMIFLGVCAWTLYHGQTRRNPAEKDDATGFLADLGFVSLPSDSVIHGHWRTSRPLWYARLVATNRTDVSIVTARPKDACRKALRTDGFPVFSAEQSGAVPPGRQLVTWRNIWRVEETEE